MKRQNAVIVAFLLLLLSYIILADEKINFSFDDIISDTEASYPAHTFVYCDNFYRGEKNYTLRYPKILNLDILAPRPGELDRGTLTLLSKYTYIEKIEDGAFDNYTNLNTLEIFLNSLQYIDDKVLKEKVATSLIDLKVNKNNLQNLPTTAFQYLTNLRSLNMSYNPRINLWVLFNGANITVFHEALANLVHLDISYCNIGHFDDYVFINLKSLRQLHISGNPITAVPMAIKSLSALQILHIQDSQIGKINDCDFCNLTKLKILDLSNTKPLSYIHEKAFGAITIAADIPLLQEFSIESCNIQIIPENLLTWKMLDNFNIRHNPLKCDSLNAWLIHDIIVAPPSLFTQMITKNWNWSEKNFIACNSKWLLLHMLFGSMCFNGTTVYEETEKYNDSLYYVCDKAGSEKFPCKIFNGHDLKCGYGHHWNYRDWHVSKYALHHSNIKILRKNFTIINADLDGIIKITVLQKDKILPGHESTIKSLSLKWNKIQTIENGSLDKFTSLEILNLGYNAITAIDGLTYPPSLTELYLNSNQLKLTSSKPFENLVNLDTLSLSKNPNILPTNSATIVFPAALSNLKCLSLKQCNITMLNDNIFVNLISLEKLILGKNPIISIPTAINVLQNLKLLNIASSPNITVLNGAGLITNLNLTEIIVTSSNIQRIEDCAFCSFPNLKYIDLSFNSELSYTHENALGDACNEKSCQLLLSFRGCNNLAIPELPIHCDCDNDNLWTLENYNTLICKSPAEFKGKSYDAFYDEVCRSRPAGAAIKPRIQDQSDSKRVDLMKEL